MSDFAFRTIAARERGAVLDLLAHWFGDRAFFARYFDDDCGFRDDLCFVATHRGMVVSTLQVFGKRVRMGGALLEVGGIGNVFTAAAYRDRGLASQLLTRAIAAMEVHGFDLSLLFAVRLAFYGRLGWQSHVRHLVFIDRSNVSPGGRYAVAPFESSDLPAVMDIYDEYNAAFNGSTVRDERYWAGQLRCAGNPREDFFVARDHGHIVAYARGTPLYDFYVIQEHGYRPGYADALTQLVCLLHGTVGMAQPGTITQLGVDPAVRTELRERGMTLRTVEDVFWMWRIISASRVAAKLHVRSEELDSDDVFARLLPPSQSVYWIADRF